MPIKISTVNISIHLIIDFDCMKLFRPFVISPSMILFSITVSIKVSL